MIELRNKRLNYYNKLIETSRLPSPCQDHHEGVLSDSFKSQPNHTPRTPTAQTKEFFPSNTSKFIDKLFDNDAPSKQAHSLKNVRKFSASLSIDEPLSQLSTSRLSSNRRLEEFKLVVETSYNQHVVNRKLENLPAEASTTTPPSPTNIFLESNQNRAPDSVLSSIDDTYVSKRQTKVGELSLLILLKLLFFSDGLNEVCSRIFWRNKVNWDKNSIIINFFR